MIEVKPPAHQFIIAYTGIDSFGQIISTDVFARHGFLDALPELILFETLYLSN